MTSPDFYAPRDASAADILAQTRATVDAILRNNPMVNAVIPRGLARWTGNYVSGAGPNKIDFLWIGEFLPADPNLGGVSQRGFSLVRDDSRGGVSAIAMYDPSPGSSPGLKQSLHFTSGDGKPLMTESRDGGIVWPQENVAMCDIGDNTLDWIGTTQPTFTVIHEGRANIIGNVLHYRMWCATVGGAAGEFQLRVPATFLGQSDILGPLHTLGVNTVEVIEGSVDVTARRGQTPAVHWDGRVTNGVGAARSVAVSVRCYTP